MATLLQHYQGLVCDLDGVVYRGSHPVVHAVDALNAAKAQGVPAVFATNNASRPPAQVADQLRRLGLEVADGLVINSSMAGARWLADRAPVGARVLAVGGPGVADALRAQGFDAVEAAGVEPGEGGAFEAVLQGYGPQVSATDLAIAAYAIQAGAHWVATNTDLTLPTQFGIAPGNGALVAAVRQTVDRDPEVVGKPGPLLYELAAAQLGTDARTTLGIGDRLETDTAGAHAAGMAVLHVLTGVHGPQDLAAAPSSMRPRYVAADLRALAEPYDEPVQDDERRWRIGDTQAVVREGRLDLTGVDDPIVGLRVALRAVWHAVDQQAMTPADARRAVGATKLDLTSSEPD